MLAILVLPLEAYILGVITAISHNSILQESKKRGGKLLNHFKAKRLLSIMLQELIKQSGRLSNHFSTMS